MSVVIPTYCPGEGLDRLVRSLDAQSMPAQDFDVVFVDDGSPDGTYQRLLTLSRSRPNYVVRRIENSGWPSRPRNIGLGLARGDYVLFMDHDDYLYPDALRTAYAFAVGERADVVSAKETRTSDWFAYEKAFLRDVGGDAPKTPSHYGPWTTHKLFRRSFLLDHDIRFREGRRALFEDVLVGVSAYVHAERIAVLASQPFYQWVHSPGSNYSGTYGRDVSEYLCAIGRIMDHAEEEASGGSFAVWVRGYQYRLRILGRLLGPGLLSRPEEGRAELVDQVSAFIADHVPPKFDDGLSPVHAARAHLARLGEVDGLVALARADRGVKPVPTATSVEWDDDGALRVDVEVRWQDHGGRPLLLRSDGDRLLRLLPADVPALPDSLIDVTEVVSRATAHLTVTDRDKIGWPTVSSPPDTTLERVGEGELTPVTRFNAVINRTGSELGRPLGSGLWDVACRAALLGYGGHRAVEFSDVPLIRGEGATVSIAYATANKHLAVRLDGYVVAVLQLSHLQSAGDSRSGDGQAVDVPICGARFTGSASLAATAVFRPRGNGSELHREGRLVVGGDHARLRVPATLPPGRYETQVRVPGRKPAVDLGVDVLVSRLGKTSIRPSSPMHPSGSAVSGALTAKLTGAISAGRRWVGRRIPRTFR